MCVCICICVCVCMCVCMYVCVCVCMYMSVCVCVMSLNTQFSVEVFHVMVPMPLSLKEEQVHCKDVKGFTTVPCEAPPG